MMTKPRVSVCIAAYKPTFLKEAIDSVLAQNYDNLEILIGDDSAGDCLKIVESYDDERIVHIPNVLRLGYAGNTWKLIQQATGDYISLLQHDDRLNFGFFEQMLSAFDRDPQIGVVLCGSFNVTDVVRTRPSSLDTGMIEDPIKAVMSNSTRMVFLPSSTLLRAEAAKSYPWPDHAVADMAMYVALALKGWKFWYVGEPLVNYRVHDEQLSSNVLSHRSSLVKLWSSFTFADPEHETLRVKLLSKAHFARAGGLIKAGMSSEARADLIRSKDLFPRIGGRKWHALWMMSYLPYLVSPATLLWNKVRQPQTRRHEGF
jgi:glycosyltransferase involved in cell wall biosynthesis